MPVGESSGTIREQLQDAKDYLEALQQGPEAVILKLEGRDSPDAIRWRLQALLDVGHIGDAAALIRDREPDPHWSDLAAYVLAANGELDAARRVVDRVSEQVSDPSIRRRDTVALAKGRLRCVQQLGEQPSAVTAKQLEELEEVISTLEPITATVIWNDRIQNELESQAVEVALQANGFLGNRHQCRRLTELLSSRKPVRMILARAALQRWIDAPADLPQRLREEHVDSFEANLAAAVIEGEYLGRPEPSFESARQLVQRADTSEQKERLFGVLSNLAQEIGEDAMQQLEELAPSLLSEDSRSLSLYKASRMLRQDRAEEAGPILEELRDEDEPQWLQVYAGYLSAKGKQAAAADYLAKASGLIPHPGLLWKAALVAYDAGHIDDSIRALEQLLELVPDDAASRNNAVALYMRKRDYANAARHLSYLVKNEPSNVEHALSYANCLALSGQTEEALSAYDALCTMENPPLAGLLDRAKLLTSMGRPEVAFDSLYQIRRQFWNDASFLAVLLNLSFTADKEDAAGEIFKQLNELQSAGKSDKDVLISMSLDDIVERHKEFAQEKNLADEQLVTGRMPWLLAEKVLGRVSYWGWFTRTQPLPWLLDDPLNRAEYSVYSTNAFAVIARRRQSSLERIECTPKNKTIVVDLTALITLHRLRILDKAADYFGKILFPSVYLPNALEEGSRLLLHQGSLRTFYHSITEALGQERVAVIDNPGVPGNRPMPYVNEHTLEEDETEHYYRLRDVLSVLHENGRITPAQYRNALAAAHNPTGVDRDHPALQPGSPVMFELSTLRTLSSSGVLEPVIETLRVHITSNAKTEASNSLRAIDAQEQVREWHDELWNVVLDDQRFVQVAHVSEVVAKLEEEDRTSNDTPIVAVSLAIQEKVPLLADDRSCQTVMFNERNGSRQAFGTDRLIVALEKSRAISRDEAADALITLMGWRYRFILPPNWFLKTLVDRFEDNPPGRQLRDVARYLHDCMRDVGLFTGIEKTSPPTSIGLRFYSEWRRSIAEFVVEVWADDRFSDGPAEKLTRWAMTEFLPSIPRVMTQPQQAHVGSVYAPRMVIVDAMLNIHKIRDARRGNRALRTIADALGVDDVDYLKTVTGVIDYASK